MLKRLLFQVQHAVIGPDHLWQHILRFPQRNFMEINFSSRDWSAVSRLRQHHLVCWLLASVYFRSHAADTASSSYQVTLYVAELIRSERLKERISLRSLKICLKFAWIETWRVTTEVVHVTVSRTTANQRQTYGTFVVALSLVKFRRMFPTFTLREVVISSKVTERFTWSLPVAFWVRKPEKETKRNVNKTLNIVCERLCLSRFTFWQQLPWSRSTYYVLCWSGDPWWQKGQKASTTEGDAEVKDQVIHLQNTAR